VKISGSCKSDKMTLFTESESLSIKFDGNKVLETTAVDVDFKIGECEVKSVLARDIGSNRLTITGIQGSTMTCPVIATTNKSNIQFEGVPGLTNPKPIVPCAPVFNSVEGGFTVDIEFSMKTAAPDFWAIFKDVSIYRKGSTSSLMSDWRGPSIIVASLVFAALLFAVLGITVWCCLRRRRVNANAKEATPVKLESAVAPKIAKSKLVEPKVAGSKIVEPKIVESKVAKLEVKAKKDEAKKPEILEQSDKSTKSATSLSSKLV